MISNLKFIPYFNILQNFLQDVQQEAKGLKADRESNLTAIPVMSMYI